MDESVALGVAKEVGISCLRWFRQRGSRIDKNANYNVNHHSVHTNSFLYAYLPQLLVELSISVTVS